MSLSGVCVQLLDHCFQACLGDCQLVSHMLATVMMLSARISFATLPLPAPLRRACDGGGEPES